MQIGIFAPSGKPFPTGEYLRVLGPAAEQRGFHSIWTAEHVVLFDDYASTYPYAPDGRIPVDDEPGVLEPFAMLNFLACATERIRLGTGVCLVPQRNPVYTAKAVATLDRLSGGRVDFGVGLGWLAEEYQALGVPFARRGARCRAYLEVMRRLWCDSVSQYEGAFYQLPPCRQYPKPLQQPHPPIHFGGESDAALRRVADLGQGWHGIGLDPDGAATQIRRLEGLLRDRGRRREDILVSLCPGAQPWNLDAIKRYRDAGVDQIILSFEALTLDDLRRTLDRLATTIVEPTRAL